MTEEKTVLVVEDEKNIVDILRFNLERKGYRVIEAYDGEEGLRALRLHIGYHPVQIHIGYIWLVRKVRYILHRDRLPVQQIII